MSNGASGLTRLVQKRNDILLAEVAAILHDIGKFCDLHMEHESSGGVRKWSNDHAYKAVVDIPASVIRLRPAAANIKKPDIVKNVLNASSPKIADFLDTKIKQVLEQSQITIHGETYALAELIMLSAPGFATHQSRNKLLDGKSGWLPALLGICHHEAHHDKPELPKSVGQQQFPVILTSSVFGYEAPIFTINHQLMSLDARLKSLPVFIAASKNPRTFIKDTLAEFEYGLGDTRRPINEVTLATWSESVAALFKSALVGSIVDSRQPDIRNWQSWQEKIINHDFQWRLLHITFDGLSFLNRASTISDLVGRQTTLQAALNAVQELLEVTYPMGNEVYRDENGSAFVVPALDGDDAEGNRLRGLIASHILDTLRQSELRGELQPRIYITEADRQAAVLHKVLEMLPPPVVPFQDSLNCWWQGETADICTACGVRPQGWGAPNDNQKRKAQGRNVCYICLERRGRRAEIWAQARHKSGEERKSWERTIWVDEVADENGCLALVAGKFDLSGWLNGDMVQTLLVGYDPANSDPNKRYIPKNPSFARLQRVWRTTQTFWQTVQDEDIPAVAQLEQQRLSISVSNAGELKEKLGDYHTYEAEIDGRRLSVIWDSKSECLLTADNLAAWMQGSADAVKMQLQPGTTITLFEPGGYGQRRQEWVPAIVLHTDIIPVNYSPTIALLTQPASFMALVPAAVALDVATKITCRYELAMSKVRNRLPLFLGLVFFDRRQPLFSALDAGRRLLKGQLTPVECTTTCNCARSRQNGDWLPAYLAHPHFEQWQELTLTTQEERQEERKSLHWRASTVMGDGNTADDWYPYVNVIRDTNGSSPAGRKQFEHKSRQWVHVSDVKKGDSICFAPSHFTWMFLDTSARRFEAEQEVHPLEELARITELWQKLKDLATASRLSESQLQAIVDLLVAKGKSWGMHSAEYSQLARAILNKEGLEGVTEEDLTSGRLQSTFELYHRILKQRLRRNAV